MSFESVGNSDINVNDLKDNGWGGVEFPPFTGDNARDEAAENIHHGGEVEKEGEIPNALLKEDQKYYEAYEKFDGFKGYAIFSDIDGTMTDNSGKIDERAVSEIKKFMEAGGVFIPVTGRARFESVRNIVEKLDLPYIVTNNGAEIFDRDGKRIYESEILKDDLKKVYKIIKRNKLIWMQNKKDPKTGEEFLFSNFSEKTEKEMKEAGIEDTVHNEEGRIGLSAKRVRSFRKVKRIPGQDYKIQMMSPDPKRIQKAYKEFREAGIPCMLNMQSEETGQFHWVEVIQGTKIDGIQWLVNSGLIGDIKEASVVGDGGNDLTMFKELRNQNGELIPNTYTAVANACDKLKKAALKILKSEYNDGPRGMKEGGAIVEMIEEAARARGVQKNIEMITWLLEEKMLNEEEVMRKINGIKNTV